jgi:hypothetical protein
MKLMNSLSVKAFVLVLRTSGAALIFICHPAVADSISCGQCQPGPIQQQVFVEGGSTLTCNSAIGFQSCQVLHDDGSVSQQTEQCGTFNYGCHY